MSGSALSTKDNRIDFVPLCTSLEGLRSTSPTPPPLRRPWLNTVTMHMSKESQVLSLSSITTADGWTAREEATGEK